MWRRKSRSVVFHVAGIRWQDLLICASLAASLCIAAAGAHFRSTHPATPNYDASAMGGAFGAVSAIGAVYILFAERRRLERRSIWRSNLFAVILAIAGSASMAWNMCHAAP